MTSPAKIEANRRNAEKSTGPKTEEGKAIVAQNAIKHGLLARVAVIKDEDPAEFEGYRRRMLQSLGPEGEVQLSLAERIVNLSWRLKRAERMQDEALDYLIELDPSDHWVKNLRWEHAPAAAPELLFGRVIARDFATGMVLDRLTLYERRIEHSLCRMMNELRLSKKQGVASGTDSLVGAGFKPALPASAETPHGVTTNGVDSVKQSQCPAQEPSAPVETQHLASPSPAAGTCDSTPEPEPSLRQTKPTEAAGSVSDGPGVAFAETQNVASLQGDAKQTQPADIHACETKPTGQAGEGVCRGPASGSLCVALP